MTWEFAYTVTSLIRCDRCGLEAEVPNRSKLPTRWIRLTERDGPQGALRACSWACAASIASDRAGAPPIAAWSAVSGGRAPLVRASTVGRAVLRGARRTVMTVDEAWQFWLARRPGGRYLRWETVREAFDAGVKFGRASERDAAARSAESVAE